MTSWGQPRCKQIHRQEKAFHGCAYAPLLQAHPLAMVFEANLKGKNSFLYLSLYLIFAKACISVGKRIVRGVSDDLVAT